MYTKLWAACVKGIKEFTRWVWLLAGLCSPGLSNSQYCWEWIWESWQDYRNTGWGTRADTVHSGKGLGQGRAVGAQQAAHGLFSGFSHVPSLLLFVPSVQLVQRLLHLLHQCLVIILETWRENTRSGAREDSSGLRTEEMRHLNSLTAMLYVVNFMRFRIAQNKPLEAI